MDDYNQNITDFVESFAHEHGRQDVLVGFADIDSLVELKELQIASEIEEIANGMPRAISIVVPIDANAIAKIEDGVTLDFYNEQIALSEFLNDLAQAISEKAISLGYEAIPYYPHVTYQDGEEDLSTTNYIPYVKHNVLAAYSGLGWIGKNGLVVTKKFGCANRFLTIFTNIPLDCSKAIFLSRCARCNECIVACDANAINGTDWAPNFASMPQLDIDACRTYCREISESSFGISSDICGKCIYVCPYTQAYIARATK